MSAPSNPPAFPLAVAVDFQFANDGMSLRDWFAGQALSGIIASGAANVLASKNLPITKMVAGSAYEYADAMLAERERKIEAALAKERGEAE